MSQVITNAFASYWQACLTDEVPVVLDAFVLANIPDLDPDLPISPDDGLPPEAHIVYRQAVDQRGRINLDAVAYTIVMDTSVGDFEFNAMYLINTETNLVGMIVHKGLEAKLKTDEATGQTGNSLVKSMLMEYDRASLTTVTTVDAGTWQIDYAARLAGMDEDMRRLTLPLYGPAWFEGDGFLVTKNAEVYHVNPGEAVVGGLLAVLSDEQTVAPDALPMGIWVDVHRTGSLLGARENHVSLVLSKTALVDYTDGGGYQHHMAQLAIINADSSVTDTRRQRTHDHHWDEILDPPTPEGIGALPEAAYTPRTDSLNSQQGAITNIKSKDMNTCLAGEFGLYEKATCPNCPPGAGFYFYCETKSIYATEPLIQIAWTYDGVGVLAWRNYSHNTDAWDAVWREAYDTGHKPTPADIGASAVSHTHTAADVGASAIGHTHTAADVGASAIGHTHTAAEVGASAIGHTHTAAEVGAAAAAHTHTAAQGNADIVASGWGQVGTTAMACCIANVGTQSAGFTIAGGNLKLACGSDQWAGRGGTLPGTWKLLGYIDGDGAEGGWNNSNWIRIG